MATDRTQALQKYIYESHQNYIQEGNYKYEVMLHTHDSITPLPITAYVTGVTKQITTDYPYEQLQMTLSCGIQVAHQMFSDYSGRPSTGQWISIKRPNKVFDKQGFKNNELPMSIDFIGYVTNVVFNMGVNQNNALIETGSVGITCSSFIYPLQVAQYKLNAGEVEDAGLTELGDNANNEQEIRQKFDPRFQTNTNTSSFFISGQDYDKFTDELDKFALEAQSVKGMMTSFINNLGYVRIPASLTSNFDAVEFLNKYGYASRIDPNGKKTGYGYLYATDIVDTSPTPILHDGSDDLRIGNFIKVAVEQDDLPPSCHLRQTMPDTDIRINDLNIIQNTYARGGSVWDLIKNSFQTSEMLFDLFFTWVPFNKADLDAGFKLPNIACLHWGAIPYVIYRMKTLNPGLLPTKEGINRELGIYDNILKPSYKYNKLEYQTEIEKSGSLYLGAPTYVSQYSVITSLPNIALAFPITSKQIINMTFNLSDTYRINSTYIEDPIVQQTNQITAGAFSTPVVNAEDAQNHGLRMIEAPYPFTSFNTPATGAIAERLYLAQGDGNRFYGGYITLPYMQTREIVPGSWLTIFFDNRDDSIKNEQVIRERLFYCYVKAVAHSFTIDPDDGSSSEIITVTYSRGSWGNIAPILPPTQTGKLSTKEPT